jgi:hypothetical protein
MSQITRCPRSGTKIAQGRLRGAIYVQGRKWLALCPACGKRPGSRHDGRVVLYADHDRSPS